MNLGDFLSFPFQQESPLQVLARHGSNHHQGSAVPRARTAAAAASETPQKRTAQRSDEKPIQIPPTGQHSASPEAFPKTIGRSLRERDPVAPGSLRLLSM